MKRRILSIAFFAISALMITAVAEDKKENKPCEGKEMCKHHKMKKGHRHARPIFNPFEGIELSDKQKNQFKELAEARKANFEKMMKEKKEKKDGEKCAKRPNPREMGKAHLDDMKKILTSDQYVKYLENIALNRPMMNKKGHRKHGFHKKDRRHSFPGFRPDAKITPMEKTQNTQE